MNYVLVFSVLLVVALGLGAFLLGMKVDFRVSALKSKHMKNSLPKKFELDDKEFIEECIKEIK